MALEHQVSPRGDHDPVFSSLTTIHLAAMGLKTASHTYQRYDDISPLDRVRILLETNPQAYIKRNTWLATVRLCGGSQGVQDDLNRLMFPGQEESHETLLSTMYFQGFLLKPNSEVVQPSEKLCCFCGVWHGAYTTGCDPLMRDATPSGAVPDSIKSCMSVYSP